MSIYEFDLKGMRRAFKDFRKTAYGKLIFVVAYIAPLVLFIAGASLTLYGLINVESQIMTYGLIVLGAFVMFFILANAFYYAEVRHFCDRNKPAKAKAKKAAKKVAKKAKK